MGGFDDWICQRCNSANSVIAVCKLSGDLFPEREASAMHVSVSAGLMNFVGCWFGAMPCCRGAGGLAGQYRFGGRSGASVVFLGIAKLVFALVFGKLSWENFGSVSNWDSWGAFVVCWD